MDEAQQFTAQFLAQQAMNPTLAGLAQHMQPYVLLESRRLFRAQHLKSRQLATPGRGWCSIVRPPRFEPGQRVAVQTAPSEYGMVVEHGVVIAREDHPATEDVRERQIYTVRLDRGPEVKVHQVDGYGFSIFAEELPPSSPVLPITDTEGMGANTPPARALHDAIREFRTAHWHLLQWQLGMKGPEKKRVEAHQHHNDYLRIMTHVRSLMAALQSVPDECCRVHGLRGEATSLYKRLVLIGAQSSRAFYAQEFEDLVQLYPGYAAQFSDFEALDYRVVDAHRNGLWLRDWRVFIDRDEETALINLNPIPLYYCRPARGWKIPEFTKPLSPELIAWGCLPLNFSYTDIPAPLWARVFKQYVQERVPDMTVGMDGMAIRLRQTFSQPVSEQIRIQAEELLGIRLGYGQIYYSLNTDNALPLRHMERFAQILCRALHKAHYGLNVIGQLYLKGEA